MREDYKNPTPKKVCDALFISYVLAFGILSFLTAYRALPYLSILSDAAIYFDSISNNWLQNTVVSLRIESIAD
jgi:hypothetical protein